MRYHSCMCSCCQTTPTSGGQRILHRTGEICKQQLAIYHLCRFLLCWNKDFFFGWNEQRYWNKRSLITIFGAVLLWVVWDMTTPNLWQDSIIWTCSVVLDVALEPLCPRPFSFDFEHDLSTVSKAKDKLHRLVHQNVNHRVPLTINPHSVTYRRFSRWVY